MVFSCSSFHSNMGIWKRVIKFLAITTYEAVANVPPFALQFFRFDIYFSFETVQQRDLLAKFNLFRFTVHHYCSATEYSQATFSLFIILLVFLPISCACKSLFSWAWFFCHAKWANPFHILILLCLPPTVIHWVLLKILRLLMQKKLQLFISFFCLSPGRSLSVPLIF